jgi:hypothetical protein
MRFVTRHTHQTLVDHVTAALTTDGWVTGTINFGARPVTIQSIAPKLPHAVSPNTVAISLDHAGPEQEAEVGGGLRSRSWNLFVDVFGEDWSTTAAIADDVFRALSGLRLPVHDYALGVDTANLIEIDDMHIDEPPAAGAIDHSSWRVVTGAIEVFYTGEL